MSFSYRDCERKITKDFSNAVCVHSTAAKVAVEIWHLRWQMYKGVSGGVPGTRPMNHKDYSQVICNNQTLTD